MSESGAVMPNPTTQLRASALRFDGFIGQRQQRNRYITPELMAMPGRLRARADVLEAYADRPLSCRLGLHNRRQHWTGGGIPGTCVTCRRDEL